MEKKSLIAKVNENGYREIEAKIPEAERLAFRKKFATVAIDIWFLAESSDRYIKPDERKLVLEFIKLLFHSDSLFPPEEYSEEIRKNILLELVGLKDNLPPLTEVTDYLRRYPNLTKAFLFDACMIIHLDGRVVTSEAQFLNDFVKMTNIPESEKLEVYRQFKAN